MTTILSMIDKWTCSMDEVWAEVLGEDSDDETKRAGQSPPAKIDQTLDKALSSFDEDKIEGLGCMLDGFFLNFSPEEEEVVTKRNTKIPPKAR